MLERFKWWLCREEMEENANWRCQTEIYARWLSEFKHVSSILDNLKGRCTGNRSYLSVEQLREELRKKGA
jgi:hypothetical protein